MKIAIGADHRGFSHKQFIQQHLGGACEWVDVGCSSTQACDYPEFALAMVKAMQEGRAEAGVLLCGTGIGMAIAANRHTGIFAGLVWNEDVARRSKENDNVNVLVLPADYVSPEQAVGMVKAWLAAHFLGDRHQRRLEMIDKK